MLHRKFIGLRSPHAINRLLGSKRPIFVTLTDGLHLRLGRDFQKSEMRPLECARPLSNPAKPLAFAKQ